MARRVLLIGFSLLAGITPGMADEFSPPVAVHPLMIIPFLLLLLSIAVVPFISKVWWERRYPFVAVGLGLIPVAYYAFWLHAVGRVLDTGMEYVSFITLICSLFVVAGGIHIRIRGKSTPLANLVVLVFGALIANIVGTTGASMILIRPYLRVNRYRLRPYHVVFFIFIVSNMGGALTPIGDPPLFLGYLKGIPFFWVVQAVWGKWLLAIGAVLGIFFVLDTLSYRSLPAHVKHDVQREHEEGEVSGLQNIFFLAVILGAVFITNPPFVRELLMLAAAAASYVTTNDEIHRKNDFNFIPVKEVAILFLGIFATMIPALDWLEHNAGELGIRTAGQFYWASGVLSSFLDNAPTYLNFLSAAIGLLVKSEIVQQVHHLVHTQGADLAQIVGPGSAEARNTFAVLLRDHYGLVASGSVTTADIATAYLLGNHDLYVQAISLGAVFFGACTYIGNGPNFMVKSIAEQSGVDCPSFFGYVVRYSLPVLIPVFFLVWLFFFRT